MVMTKIGNKKSIMLHLNEMRHLTLSVHFVRSSLLYFEIRTMTFGCNIRQYKIACTKRIYNLSTGSVLLEIYFDITLG